VGAIRHLFKTSTFTFAGGLAVLPVRMTL